MIFHYISLNHEARSIFHQDGALRHNKINVHNCMKVFLESIKESSIETSFLPSENIIMKPLNGIPLRFFWNISPMCFLLQVPFESFTNHLPFVSPFGLVPALLVVRLEKIIEITYLSWVYFVALRTKSCLPLVSFCTSRVPLSNLCITVCLNNWCSFGESRGLGNHYFENFIPAVVPEGWYEVFVPTARSPPDRVYQIPDFV